MSSIDRTRPASRPARARCAHRLRAWLSALVLCLAAGCTLATPLPEPTVAPAPVLGTPAASPGTPAAPGPPIPETLPTSSWSVLIKQGRDALRTQDLPAAESNFTQAYVLTRDFRRGDPRTAATAKNLQRVATAYYATRELEAFERVMGLVAQSTLDVPDARTPEVAELFKAQAAAFAQQERHAEARDSLEHALTIFGNEDSDADPALVGLHAQLGITYLELGDEERGRHHSQLAIGIAESAQGSESPLYAQALVGRARLEALAGNEGVAEADLLEAIRISVAHYGEHDPTTGAVVYELAGLYRDLGRNESARAQYERVISIWDGIPGERFQQAVSRNELAWLLVETGQADAAEGLARKALELLEAQGISGLPLASVADTLATALRDQGKYEEAEGLYRRALDVEPASETSSDPGIALHYAELLEATGRVEEASRLRASAAVAR